MNPLYQSNTNSFSKSFSIEYTAVILIVLGFIISAFTTQDTTSVQTPLNFSIPMSYEIGHYKIDQVFSASNGALEKQKLIGLINFLKNHDVNAELNISIAGGRDNTALDHVKQALIKATELHRYLIDQQLPASALSSVVIQDGGDPQALTVNFIDPEVQ